MKDGCAAGGVIPVGNWQPAKFILVIHNTLTILHGLWLNGKWLQA
jgi:hypothetical protein